VPGLLRTAADGAWVLTPSRALTGRSRVHETSLVRRRHAESAAVPAKEEA